jgi:hypothetical protein
MGGSAQCHMEEGKWEKERGPWARWSTAQTTRSGWLRAARSEVAARARGGGRPANRGGWRGAGDAVRLTGGARCQWGLVVNGGVPTGGPGPHSAGARFKLGFKLIQKYSIGSNEIQIPLNFGLFKRYLPALQKFKINMVGKNLN